MFSNPSQDTQEPYVLLEHFTPSQKNEDPQYTSSKAWNWHQLYMPLKEISNGLNRKYEHVNVTCYSVLLWGPVKSNAAISELSDQLQRVSEYIMRPWEKQGMLSELFQRYGKKKHDFV